MKFKAKNLNVRTGGILIALMHVKDANYLDLYSMDRIRIMKNGRSVIATLDITTSYKMIKPWEIGLFYETSSKLKTKMNEMVEVILEKRPESIALIKNKLRGSRLNEEEMYSIIKDIARGDLTDIEITYYVAACYTHELTLHEIVALTKAMINTGEVLELNKRVVVDKHCIGGVAGNRTTSIIVPILASAGITIPNTSSRSITSAAGTADTMEVFCNVELPLKKMKEVVRKTNGCLVWGGALNLAPSDDKIIKVEYPLSLDPTGQLIASIIAKKMAVSATHVLIDIPVGRGAKIEHMRDAIRLKKLFLEVAKALNLKVKIYITNGSQPIGNGIGPVLEAKEIIHVLRNDHKGRYHDILKRKSLHIAGDIFELCGKIRRGKGYMYAKKILESGKAHEKFIEIIKAQGVRVHDPDKMRVGKFCYTAKAKKSGRITHIDNKIINRLARIAGAPHDKEAGVYLHVHKNYAVKKGDTLFTIYSDNKDRLLFAKKEYEIRDGIEIK